MQMEAVFCINQSLEDIILQRNVCHKEKQQSCIKLFIPPTNKFVGGILFSRCPSVHPSFRPSIRDVLVFL